MPDIDVFESISVAELADPNLESYISVSDSPILTESVTAYVMFPISVSETITIADVVTVMFDFFIGVDSREGYGPTAPIWELDATTGVRLELDATAPTAEGSGRFGSILDEASPVAECAGTVSQEYAEYLSLDKRAPVSTVSGRSGSRADVTAPVAELSAVSYSNYLHLDSTVPFPSIQATITFDFYILLDSRAPYSTLVASCRAADIATLDKISPTWYGSGVILEILNGALDQNAPVAELDATMDDNGISLDSIAPAWLIDSHTAHDNPSQPIMSDDTRFDDLILQYERWPVAV